MANNPVPNLNLLLSGVGSSTLVYADGSVLEIDSAQDLQIQTTATMGKQEGGSSLWPLLQFVTAKTGKVTFTNATFSLNQAKFTQGGTLNTGTSETNVVETKTPIIGTCTLGQITGVLIDTVVAVDTVTGLSLKQVTGTPIEDEFKVTAAGVVTVDTLMVNPVKFNYYFTDATGVSLDILNDSVTGNCELRHTLISEQQPDGNRYKVSVRVYSCKCTGNFAYDAKKAAAFSPKLEFEIQDSGRADNRSMTYSCVKYLG
jgi:hypothetical protein